MNISRYQMRERILMNEILENIKNIDKQLKIYARYISEEGFNNSKEVAELYYQLKDLINFY